MKLFFYVFLLVSSFVFSQNTVHIYKDSVFSQLKGYQTKSSFLDSLKNVYTSEVQSMRSKLKADFNDLLNFYQLREGETLEQLKIRMSEKDKEQVNLLQEREKELNIRLKSYNVLLEDKFKNDIEPYINLVNLALDSYEKKNKIDYIWVMEEVSNKLAYINKKKNITKEIVEIVNKKLNF